MNTMHAITPTDSRDVHDDRTGLRVFADNVARGTQADPADFAHARAGVDDDPDDPVAAAIVCLVWLLFLVVVIVGVGAWPHIRAWWAAL